MPTDETRRVLKVFGVAVTAYEDAVEKGASPEELRSYDLDRAAARKKEVMISRAIFS